MNVVLHAPDGVALDQHAHRIRDLVNVARGCIIEVGRELIAAKAQCRHGEWLPWLEREFGWSEDTARRYMDVADGFASIKSRTVQDLPDAERTSTLTIEASALYLLARPTIPQEVREEAVERADAGEDITVAEVEKMVAERVAKAADDLRAADLKRIAELQARIEEAEASSDQTGKIEVLTAQIRRLEERLEPDVDKFVRDACTMLKVKRLKPRQISYLAAALGMTISDGKNMYPPVEPVALEANHKGAEQAAAIITALQAFERAAPAKDVAAFCRNWPGNAKSIDRLGETARRWLDEFASAYGEVP